MNLTNTIIAYYTLYLRFSSVLALTKLEKPKFDTIMQEFKWTHIRTKISQSSSGAFLFSMMYIFQKHMAHLWEHQILPRYSQLVIPILTVILLTTMAGQWVLNNQPFYNSIWISYIHLILTHIYLFLHAFLGNHQEMFNGMTFLRVDYIYIPLYI